MISAGRIIEISNTCISNNLHKIRTKPVLRSKRQQKGDHDHQNLKPFATHIGWL